jgi:hypothetical protein
MLNLNDVKTLLDVQPMLSLYLNVNAASPENQATTPAWRNWLNRTLRDLENASDIENNEIWQAARTRVDDYFDSYEPQSKGLVMFLGKDVEHVFELPMPVTNHASFGVPAVAPLVWAIDEYEPSIVVRVDHKQAHFMVIYLGGIEYEDKLTHDLDVDDWHTEPRGDDAHDQIVISASNKHYRLEARVEEHIERFFRDVAQRVQMLSQQYDTQRIILGGIQESAHALKELLTGVTVIDVLALPLRDSPAEVLEKVLPVARDYERGQEAALVDEVINLAKAGGRAALGAGPVGLALQEGRVELLIASWTSESDTVTERLIVQALANNAKIELVHGDAATALNAEGGVAARLFYAV